MTKMKAAVATLLGVVMLALYFTHPISISWNGAGSVSASPVPASENHQRSLSAINAPSQGKVWVCPMHHEIMQDHPGTCPICGMDLVEAKDHPGHEYGVHVDAASVQKLGIRLAAAARVKLARDIQAYGNVVEDGNAIYTINSKMNGIIEKTYIHSVGQKIKKGQVIYEIYSPELIMQQKEFISFIERRNQLAQNVDDNRFKEDSFVMDLLQDLSRERTRFLHEGVSLDSVQKVEDSSMVLEVVKIVAPESGVVTRINVREGAYVALSELLYTFSNVNRVWVDITLYPDQAGQVRTGDAVTIRSQDGVETESTISFISPVAEGNKVVARAVLANGDLRLRPGSFVDATVHAASHEALALPRSAVMRNGDGNLVMLSRGDGHFLPAPVETGVESRDWVEITDGLQEGAEVAVNGQFLLDAAASLNDTVERMHGAHMHK